MNFVKFTTEPLADRVIQSITQKMREHFPNHKVIHDFDEDAWVLEVTPDPIDNLIIDGVVTNCTIYRAQDILDKIVNG